MRAKAGSATTLPPEDLGRQYTQGVRSKRSPREVTPVGRPAKASGNEAARDLRILNRKARRLNREARDVLSFQVPVWKTRRGCHSSRN